MRPFRELLQLTPGDMTDDEWEYCQVRYARLSDEEKAELARQSEARRRQIDDFTDAAEQSHLMPSHPERDA